MKNERKIAILMATYNGGLYLKEQIDSIINQSYNNWTLYIRDDGSTDNTISIIREYTQKDERIKIVEDEKKHRGPAMSFLFLTENVDSDLYMFCDQDDVWLEDKIKTTLDKYLGISNHDSLPVIIHSDVSVVDENLNMMAQSFWKDINMNPDKINKFEYLCISGFINGNTMLFNRQTKDACFPIKLRVSMHDKYVSCIVYKKNGIVAAIHQPLVLYRQRGDNVCGVQVGQAHGIRSRILHLDQVFSNIEDGYRVCKGYGFESFAKYLWYRFLFQCHLRLKSNY